MTEMTLQRAPHETRDDAFDHLTREGMATTLCGLPCERPMSDDPRFGTICVVCRAIAYSTGITWDRKGRQL